MHPKHGCKGMNSSSGSSSGSSRGALTVVREMLRGAASSCSWEGCGSGAGQHVWRMLPSWVLAVVDVSRQQLQWLTPGSWWVG